MQETPHSSEERNEGVSAAPNEGGATPVSDTPKSNPARQSLVLVGIGMLIGAFLAMIFLQYGVEAFKKSSHAILVGGLVGLFFGAFTIALVMIFRKKIFERAVGWTRKHANDLRSEAAELYDASTQQRWSDAKGPAGRLAAKFVDWYSWITFRKWIMQLFSIIALFFSGMLGSILLFQQNEIMDLQNKRIEDQSTLMESERRNGKEEVTAILDQINAFQLNQPNERLFPKTLVDRIVASSRNFLPYRYQYATPSGGQLIPEKRSPERGQLLRALVEMRPSNLNTIVANSCFNHADAPGIELKYLGVLEKIQLDSAHLHGARFERDTFLQGQLAHATLTGATFYECVFIGGDFQGANFRGATFRNVQFKGVRLQGSNFLEANILSDLGSEPNLDFEGSEIQGIKISADLRSKVQNLPD